MRRGNIRFPREKDNKKAKGARPSSALSAAAPILGKKGVASKPAASAAKLPAQKNEDKKVQVAERPEAEAAAVAGNSRKKQRLEEPAPEAGLGEARQQEGNSAPEAELPSQGGKRKTRASLRATVAHAEGAAVVQDLPHFSGAAEPAVPFHEGLTKEREDQRLVQLLRRICRHEQEAVDAAFGDHQHVATAADTVMRNWVRAVQTRLKEDPSMVGMSQSILAGSSLGPGAAEAADEEDDRREALLTLRSNLRSQEKAWQRLIASQEAILERDAEARAQAPKADPPAVESVGLDTTLEETRRKLAFQAEALCQLVSGVSDLCRRTEQASKDLAQDFGAKFTSILPQGSPRTLINRFMSYHPASGPS
ncbi:hypothetical protein KFL_000280040 [Klebsormidium nitens]|uniref:Uncharacterized protein n=1 Tax=Klebsormidium nitens TaxID=105231 RepID=A0A1Y1HQ22_KLENI|nr:hypothetical protein KFL_000280040 [Klebsormidium nitens]|eukprot:GAQ79299.1 hypothetical protein KFL_000280040 [Klebsormidium nitens]